MPEEPKRLLIPYIFTWFLIIFLDELKAFLQRSLFGIDADYLGILKKWFLSGLYASGVNDEFVGMHIDYIGAIWYFVALIWSVLFTYIILRIAKKTSVRVLSSVLLFILGIQSSKIIWLPFSIQSGLTLVLFIYVPYQLKTDGKWLKIITNMKLIIVFLLVWGIDVMFAFANNPISVSKAYFPFPIINILGAFSGSFLIVSLCKKIELFCKKKEIETSILRDLGRFSDTALCAHRLLTLYFPWGRMSYTIHVLLMLLLTYFCVWIRKKIMNERMVSTI